MGVALATGRRDVSNGPRRIERVIGRPVPLLAGDEEVRPCFLGRRAGVRVGSDSVLGLAFWGVAR